MAQKKTSQSAFNSEVAWINVDLSEQQSADMKKALNTTEIIMDGLLKLLESGYKVTLSWDARNDAHACYIIPKDPKGDNGGKILSARGGSPSSAIRGALFRHYYIFEGHWGDRVSQQIDDD